MIDNGSLYNYISPLSDSLIKENVLLFNNNCLLPVSSTIEVCRSSIIFPANHPKTQIKPQPIKNHDLNWVFIVFILCFALFSWVQIIYRKRFIQLIKASFSNHYIVPLMRDGDVFNERNTIALFVLFPCMVALLLFQTVSQFFFISGLPILIYAKVLIWIFLFYIFKIYLTKLLGSIFKISEITYEFRLITLLNNLLIGILLLPLLVVNIYASSLIALYVGICIFAMLSLYKLFRYVILSLSKPKFPKLYLFIYLCTIEILPFIVLIKLAITYYAPLLKFD